MDCFQFHFNALESEGLPGGLEGAELTQKRERAYAVLLSTEQRSSAQSAVICLIIFVLCCAVLACICVSLALGAQVERVT